MNEGVITPVMSEAKLRDRDLKRASAQNVRVKELTRSIERAASDVLRGPHTKRMMEHCTVETRVPCRKFGILPGQRLEERHGAKVFFRPISRGQTGRTYLAILGNDRVYCSGVRLHGQTFKEAMTPQAFTEFFGLDAQLEAMQGILDFLLSRT